MYQGFQVTMVWFGSKEITVIYRGQNIGIIEMMKDESTGLECYRVTGLDGWQTAEYGIESAVGFLIEHSKGAEWIEPPKDNRARKETESIKYRLA